MKKIIPILFVIFSVYTNANAQGNLQFNKVVNIEHQKKLSPTFAAFSGINYFAYSDTVITVPIGKIWKIESATSSYSQDTTFSSAFALNSNFNGSWWVDIILNNVRITNGLDGIKSPIYLQAGTYRLGMRMHSSTNTFTWGCKMFISAIEFNVVP